MALPLGKQQEMFDALRKIAREYMTPEELRRSADKDYGVSYEEALEMAYENIQLLARNVTHGMRRPK